jgi:hypothetical protein
MVVGRSLGRKLEKRQLKAQDVTAKNWSDSIFCVRYYRLHTSAASSLKKKKNPTTHKRPAKKNPRIAARPLDELIRPLWAESKGFQYIP